MSPELTQAMEYIRKACSSMVANLENHQLVQQALNTVEQALTPDPEPVKKETAKS